MTRAFRQGSVREEVDAELAFHLEMTTCELMEAGMTRQQARAEAERRFGDASSVVKECQRYGDERDRRARRAIYREELGQDVAFALRQLPRAPGFAIVAIVTLALGIGATAAVFSALDAVVLRPLPFDHAERLVVLTSSLLGTNSNPLVPEYLALRQSRVFEKVAGFVPGIGVTMKLGDGAEVVVGARVSANYFDLFGMPPQLGRTFGSGDDIPGAPKMVVISHRLWVDRFNQDAAVVGRTVQLDGEPHTIIAVMPAQFDIARGGPDIFVPLVLPPTATTDYSARFMLVFARLKPGQSIPQAAAAGTAVERRVAETMPQRTSPASDFGIHVDPMQSAVIAGTASVFYVLLGAVGFVLLIACTNVANLLLARGTSRARELAIRAALGAGRARLVRQLVTESLVLGAAGAVVGIGLAAVLLRLILRAGPAAFPLLDRATIDWRVLVFTLLLGLASCLIFGLLPALRAARSHTYDALREGGRFGSGLARDRLRGLLVAAEVALAITLLVASGSLLRSAWLIARVDPGFDPRGVFAARVLLPPARYPGATDVTRAFARIRETAAGIPGVRSAALTTITPLDGLIMSSGVSVGSQPQASDAPPANVRIVSPGYFGAMGIALRVGRDFTASDDRNSPKTAVVNEALARLLWPSLLPRQILGQRLNGLGTDTVPNVMEVIGIVADVRDEQLTTPAKPAFYVPVDQTPDMIWPLLQRSIVVVLRSATPNADAAALERPLSRAIAGVDPSLPVANPHTMMRALTASQATGRMTTLLLSSLGGIALALAVVGIYGVVSYFVGQRTQEIGLRMALGATESRIWQFVVRRGLAPVGAGVVIGLGLSLITTGALRAQLYGVTVHDPITLLSVTALLALVALLAIYVPARQALRVAPSVALGNG